MINIGGFRQYSQKAVKNSNPKGIKTARLWKKKRQKIKN